MAITPGIRPVSTLDASNASIGESTSEDLHDTHARMPIAVRRIRFAITAYSRSFKYVGYGNRIGANLGVLQSILVVIAVNTPRFLSLEVPHSGLFHDIE